MDYSTVIWSVAAYIECRLGEEIHKADVERATGFSFAHLRSIFSSTTGQPLQSYINGRKVARAAFDLLHTDEDILQIALKYSFTNPDTFTRAFRRHTGMNPSVFRQKRPGVGRVRLWPGAYGVGLLEKHSPLCEEESEMENYEKSGVLYGVPKVGYGVYGCTTYPICVKACLDFLGEAVPYETVMVLGGAAFRFTWNTTIWDGGNVDVSFAFDQPHKIYETTLRNLGHSYKQVGREQGREAFFSLIRHEINAGRPCIAMGIIGPPEACVITGYREDGEALLGWSFFQDYPDYQGNPNISQEECGYFAARDWWENPCTSNVIAIGEKEGGEAALEEVLPVAIEVLTGRQHEDMAKGLCAYDAWREAVLDDKQFFPDAVLSIQWERLMCLTDAFDCLRDGRTNAAKYFRDQALLHPECSGELHRIGDHFEKVVEQVVKICELFGLQKGIGQWIEGDYQTLVRREIREQMAEMITLAKEADHQALKELVSLAMKGKG